MEGCRVLSITLLITLSMVSLEARGKRRADSCRLSSAVDSTCADLSLIPPLGTKTDVFCSILPPRAPSLRVCLSDGGGLLIPLSFPTTPPLHVGCRSDLFSVHVISVCACVCVFCFLYLIFHLSLNSLPSQLASSSPHASVWHKQMEGKIKRQKYVDGQTSHYNYFQTD